MTTALEIKQTAAAYNAAYPGAAEEIMAGAAILVVTIANRDRHGRAYIYNAVPAVQTSHGGHAYAAELKSVTQLREDGRERMTARAQRVARRLWPEVPADVPVVVVDATR